jgi:hypothetical protein
MDSLALLCNLYGDGPQTLRRLREAGCGTLVALESIESERLASLLRTSVRAARRFQTEGRMLRERCEPPAERANRRKASDMPTDHAAAAASPLLAPVLVAWRERDARVGSHEPPSDGPPVGCTPTGGDELGGDDVALEDFEGMDATLIASLRAAGVGSPRDLCVADALDLAVRGVAGYTRLLRVQFLARRRMGAQDERCPRAGALSARPDGSPSVSVAATVHSEHVNADTGVDAMAGKVRHGRVDQAALCPESASTPLLEPIVVIPHPPPERRRAERSQTTPRSGAEERFSPRSDSCALSEPTLQSELLRYALDRGSVPEDPASGTASKDEGSSGPFA